ncbi:serine hydrolase domain-containing protein [Viridibacterium curvum]|uniref:Beta-lactamase-related domain-containing protein n=1 Tax=Viridibacterium curvum TaxID=1101404 RepID=A0ABP9QPZ4_9RHOO
MFRMPVLLCLFCVGVLQASAQTPVAVSGQSLPGMEALDEAMQSLMQNNGYPGGTLAVAFQGRLVLNKAYGLAKSGVFSKTPMQVDQRMRIASMSKLITAVAALKAAEQGKLDLDQPFVKLLGFPANPAEYADPRVLQITVRQLLQNHAGWTIDRAKDPMFERTPACPGSAARWLANVKLDAEPGQLYSYGNINFCLAQQVIEKATGQKYVDFVKTHIAAPAGIRSWEFATLRGKDDEPEYVSENGSAYSGIDFESLGGAGAWTSTAADYVRFLSALRNHGGRSLLSAASFAQLYGRPAAAASAGNPVYYGLGVRARMLDATRVNLWHSGSLPGTSSLGLSYASGWNIVVIFNSRVAGPDRDQATGDTDRLLGQAAGKIRLPPGEIAPLW